MLVFSVEVEILLKVMQPSSKDYAFSPYFYYAIANSIGAVGLVIYLLVGEWAWSPISGCMISSSGLSQ
jgi:hypothetical protein